MVISCVSPALDTSCVAEVPPVQFVTDVHVNGGVFHTLQRFASGPSIGQMAGLGGLGLVLLSGLLMWPVGYAIRRVRRLPITTTRPQQMARWTAALAALVVIGFVAGLGITVAGAASSNPFLLAFGVPSGAGWLFVLPWIGGGLALAALGAAAVAWRHGWWSAANRIHFTLVAAASAAAILLAVKWGLL